MDRLSTELFPESSDQVWPKERSRSQEHPVRDAAGESVGPFPEPYALRSQDLCNRNCPYARNKECLPLTGDSLLVSFSSSYCLL